MNLNHQSDDTGGLLAALLCLIALVAFITIIAWIAS